ncbi:MAG TPA: hypothetical protein VMV10_27330 [Pirellulales bacterium]|nr:hypothetical protein [Pirellulales bacterium]
MPELEAIHGQLVTPVPVRPSAEQLAEAVRQALSSENRVVVERAKRLAWANYTAQAMGDRWTKFLTETASAARDLAALRPIDAAPLA